MGNWLLLGLALLGTGISLYFTLVYYGRLESPELPPALCRREERACLTILETPYARLLGVPNALVGIGFYALTGLVASLSLAGVLPRWLWFANFLVAVGTVVVAPYLVWALVARLKVWCRL